MISFLRGEPIIEKEFVTILVGGVGYAVRVTELTRQQLTAQAMAELYIYTHVREEALELYGFPTKPERDLFLLLLSVSGVGPKTALGILNFETGKIISSIQNADITLFAQVPRVGKKLAQKIIIELRSKLGALKELDLAPISPQRQEVMLALQSLGFAEPAIEQVIHTIEVEEISLSEAVRLAIQELGKPKLHSKK